MYQFTTQEDISPLVELYQGHTTDEGKEKREEKEEKSSCILDDLYLLPLDHKVHFLLLGYNHCPATCVV